MSDTPDRIPSRTRFLSPRLADPQQAADFQMDVEAESTVSAEEQAEIRAIIREGIEDIKAGRYRPADDVTRDLRRKYGL